MELACLALALAGSVFALDLLWGALGASSGSLAFALVDEPAHLATCGLALLALAALVDGRLPPLFAIAALLTSVAIDLDHIPQYIGLDAITSGAPRPYTHSPALLAMLLLSGLILRGRMRTVAIGVAFGLGAHLLRDAATGPGIALAPPPLLTAIDVPYVAYAVTLISLASFALARAGRGEGAVPLGASRERAVRPEWAIGAIAAAVLATGLSIPDRADAARVAVGAYIPGAEGNPALIDHHAAAVGRSPAIVHIYRDWGKQPFELNALSGISSRGALPLVTWEPWHGWKDGVSLWDIANGVHDAYILDAARHAANWRQPLFVRFAHEMNGDWYPWGRGNNGNTPRAYKAAWRRIVAIFRGAGARNVRWVWTPYVEIGSRLSFKRFYPGDRWVDWAGLDGFNWGNPFVPFAKVFQRSYRKLVAMTSKPLMIAETGSTEAGGSKARWVWRAMRHALPRFEQVRALVWWSAVHPDGSDWRVDTSSPALSALRRSLRGRRFAGGRKTMLRPVRGRVARR